MSKQHNVSRRGLLGWLAAAPVAAVAAPAFAAELAKPALPVFTAVRSGGIVAGTITGEQIARATIMAPKLVITETEHRYYDQQGRLRARLGTW